MQVIPYEHKGKTIIGYQLKSVTDAYKVFEEFRNEKDIWLKKLLAIKLLGYINESKMNFNKSELLKAIECQINI